MFNECGKASTDFVFYRYNPSLAAAAVFTVLFGLNSVLHIYQSAIKRSHFMIPFIIGGIMQTLLLLLGPVLFAASIYMILGRIIVLTGGEQYSFVRPSWLTKIFVGGDIFSFLLQSAGGGILSGANGDEKKMDTGEHLILAGLFVQLLFFGVFVAAAAVFQRRSREHLNALDAKIAWKKHLYVLYTTSALLLVRSVFRVIEYIQGNAGYLKSHEVYVYIFDAALMLAVVVVTNLIHPGDIAGMLKEKLEDMNIVELGHAEAKTPSRSS